MIVRASQAPAVNRDHLPLDEKESVRWVDGYQRVNELAEQVPETRLTYVADCEADIYDLFVEAPCPESAADWLVRGQHDRVLADGRTLRQRLTDAPVLAETTFERPATHVSKARVVQQQIKAIRVTLPAPPPSRPGAPRRRGHGHSRHRAAAARR